MLRKSRESGKPDGIAPTLLLEQVKSTAAWAFTFDPPLPAVEILAKASEVEKSWRAGEGANDYLSLLLAAHFTTVGTFCPTDVDARIRHHVWSQLSATQLAAAIDRVAAVTPWDPRAVSARFVMVGDEVLAGHQGEWFSVMAGALGRALALKDRTQAERTRGWIEAELAREARIVTRARKSASDQDLLSVVTTVAHNLGDLSRVVDTWAPSHAESNLGLRYRRLGHEDASRFDGAFVYAGELNKARMANENHRFLPLREPLALRRERAFLLPFGPYFYDWGRMIGSTKLLDDRERAEVLLALVSVHERRTNELGCLRAITGIHEAYAGGIDKLGRVLRPDQACKLVRGGIRLALREPEKAFRKRFHARLAR